MNSTLVTLILDFNIKLGSDGMKNLSRGLCTNSTLKKLSVKYCGIDQNDYPQTLSDAHYTHKPSRWAGGLWGSKVGG